MLSTRHGKKRGEPVSSLSLGDGFKVSLTCPHCGVQGLVDWKNLKNGIGCPSCGCQFLIGRNGQVLVQEDLPHARYTCPRCKQSGAIPVLLSARGAVCDGCGLALALGPDQRLHGTKEAEELRRASVGAGARRSLRARARQSLTDDDGKVRKPALVVAVSMLASIVVVVGVAVAKWFDNSPETLAKHFVYSCLSGESKAALAYLEEDAVQEVEFDRWRIRYFPSIVDKHRPAGDRVRVDVQVSRADDGMRVLLVTMKSPFIGSRSHVQHWRLRGEEWKFDARATLAAQAPKRQRGRGFARQPGNVPRRGAINDGATQHRPKNHARGPLTLGARQR